MEAKMNWNYCSGSAPEKAFTQNRGDAASRPRVSAFLASRICLRMTIAAALIIDDIYYLMCTTDRPREFEQQTATTCAVNYVLLLLFEQISICPI